MSVWPKDQGSNYHFSKVTQKWRFSVTQQTLLFLLIDASLLKLSCSDYKWRKYLIKECSKLSNWISNCSWHFWWEFFLKVTYGVMLLYQDKLHHQKWKHNKYPSYKPFIILHITLIDLNILHGGHLIQFLISLVPRKNLNLGL